MELNTAIDARFLRSFSEFNYRDSVRSILRYFHLHKKVKIKMYIINFYIKNIKMNIQKVKTKNLFPQKKEKKNTKHQLFFTYL